MKKIFAIMLMFAVAVGLVACGSSTSGESSESSSESGINYDENGNRIHVSASSYVVYPNELPCGVDYNGEELVLENVDFFEQKIGNEYQLFSTVKLDVSALDEEHLEQLQQGVNLSVGVYITSTDNGYDFDGLTELGHVYLAESEELLYGFRDTPGHRDWNSFSGSSVSCSIDVRVDDEDLSMRTIQYTTLVPSDLLDEDGMDETTRSYMEQWSSTTLE